MAHNLDSFTGLLFFSADWAGDACAAVRQFLNTQCTVDPFELVEITENEENDETFDKFRVEAVPAVVSLVKGREIGRVIGFVLKDLNALLSDLKSGHTNSNSSSIAKEASFANKTPDYKALVSTAPLMLFIKGTAEQPRCGFTGQLIRLLAEHKLEPHRHYQTFNILADEHVRQGLKEFSQWPTYPQVYWKGELLGGLDILKEMFATGQMDAIIEELREE